MSRALPDAWTFATPGDVLRARRDGARAALRNLLTDEVTGPDDLRAAADLAWQAAGLADTAGRVLSAANQALPAPGESHLLLWQAATTLREHRGDGHVAALITHGVPRSRPTCSRSPPVRPTWPCCARRALAGRGVGVRCRRPARARVGRRLRRPHVRGHAGARADRTADRRGRVRSLASLGDERTSVLARLLRPLACAVVKSGFLPPLSPIGLPLPSATGNENGRELSLPAFPSQIN